MKKQILSLLVILSAPTFSAQSDINTQALKACSFIENDFNRLLCYDNTMAGKPLTQSTVTQKVKAPTTATNVPVVAVEAPKDDFGLEHKKDQAEKDSEIKAAVTPVDKAPYGELIITLDNNQKWRQVGSDSMRLKKSDAVTITRGAFNSFLLRKDGQNRSIRVKRTK